MKASSKFIKLIGTEVVFMTTARCVGIALESENWDLMLVVRYPNRSAMLKMLVNPDYQAIARHRKAALADSRLIEMDPSYQVHLLMRFIIIADHQWHIGGA